MAEGAYRDIKLRSRNRQQIKSGFAILFSFQNTNKELLYLVGSSVINVCGQLVCIIVKAGCN